MALLISCSDYSTLRKTDGFGDFNDNKYADIEIASVKTNLIKMNFAEEDIKILTNPKCTDVKKAFEDIMNECWGSNLSQEKTLVHFYFNGHGSMDTTTQIVLNGRDQVFPAEKMLRILASFKDTYVMALLDCTRKRVDPSLWTVTNDYTTLSFEMLGKLASQNCINKKQNSNLIITQVSQPSAEIFAKPTTQVFYFKHLMLGKNASSKIMLPRILQTFAGVDNKAELVMDVVQPLEVMWKGTDYGKVLDNQHKEYSDCVYDGQTDEAGLRHGIGKLVF